MWLLEAISTINYQSAFPEPHIRIRQMDTRNTVRNATSVSKGSIRSLFSYYKNVIFSDNTCQRIGLKLSCLHGPDVCHCLIAENSSSHSSQQKAGVFFTEMPTMALNRSAFARMLSWFILAFVPNTFRLRYNGSYRRYYALNFRWFPSPFIALAVPGGRYPTLMVV